MNLCTICKTDCADKARYAAPKHDIEVEECDLYTEDEQLKILTMLRWIGSIGE